MTSFAMNCLGCKVNAYEAECVRQTLLKRGYEEKSFKECADVYIVFTCAVTNTAAQKSRQRFHQAMKQSSEAIKVVVGCYVQVALEKLMDEPIDILVGSSSKDKIPDLIEEYRRNHERIIAVKELRTSADFEVMKLDSFEHQTRAYLKVQDGCNQFCSYCVIPYARGKERCMKPEDVIEAAISLSNNHKEIVLTGIHTGRYGHDFDTSLCKLIEGILASCPKLERVRISSIEVTEVSDELIDLMKREKRVAKHFHIPLQSGCDATLKRMNRPYTTSEFLKKINYIREQIPDISISTDLIVGFQGESEEEYQSTLKFLKEVDFSFMHVFPFSMKSNTAAEKMKGTIPDNIKKQRVQEVLNLSKEGYRNYMQRFVGREVEVLTEENEGYVTKGHTSEYVPVTILGSYKSNELIKVSIETLKAEAMVGKAVVGNETE
ncbi:MAG: tRNA (N(6)-L-threonylcarbamoyladenosine(37)-C(2))-methylthiotransferase MtaB [Erysipelotrichaceae bacterium]|nr:tRNA (N(6)-L-threonylcarbamoyladenosine(37)-C(2))-methylthiotransferase MtaB [Erysipelotrichaceae bacterium]